MNYANMIEEKHLKKGFIIATLISTVIGTFTTSVNLYERVRDRHRQHKTDHHQDEKIRDLERRIDASESARSKAETAHRKHHRGNGNGDNNNSNDNNNNNNDPRAVLADSGPLIRRAYDDHYARLGPRFAAGDAITQTQLQAQIIDLQASVIHLLQEALATGGTLPDPALLAAAAERARTGSLRALQDQHRRMLAAAGPLPPVAAAAAVAASGGKGLWNGSGGPHGRWPGNEEEENDHYDDDRNGNFHWPDQRSNGQRRRHLPIRRALPPPSPPPLFCRYALLLQNDWRRPLDLREGGRSDSGRNGGRGDPLDPSCPACGGPFAIELDRSWKLHKPVVVGERVQEIVHRDNGDVADAVNNDGYRTASPPRMTTTQSENVVELVEARQFVLSNRFIVKCHRPATSNGGGRGGSPRPPTYACCLCVRFNDARDEDDALLDGDDNGSGSGSGSGRGGSGVAVCGSMARLVNHVCMRHSVGELLADPDIRELRPTRR
ncbi:hypothetical protein SPI_02363 [Niveomyces insectorum RCEF 264]|uniref:Uncharacterized protein n=1 Tax=Niveomyces insectorum RCEF 264 TaxID=1081102 RepID=A0A167XYE5_9HYPO|nr:hypothetical protein SPI_02363 [Niveomyces insectorum RCEF 264]